MNRVPFFGVAVAGLVLGVWFLSERLGPGADRRLVGPSVSWCVPQGSRNQWALDLVGSSLWLTWGARDRVFELERASGEVVRRGRIDPAVHALRIAEGTDGTAVLIAGVRPDFGAAGSAAVHFEPLGSSGKASFSRVLVVAGLPLAVAGDVVLVREDDAGDFPPCGPLGGWTQSARECLAPSGESARIAARSLVDGRLLWRAAPWHDFGWWSAGRAKGPYAPTVAVAFTSDTFVVSGLWEQEDRLAAHDAASGARVWERAQPHGTELVSEAADCVALRQRDSIITLDSATGRQVGSFSFPPNASPRYACVELTRPGGVRVVHAGETADGRHAVLETDGQTGRQRLMCPDGCDGEPLRAGGADVFLFSWRRGAVTAVERTTGRVRWQTVLEGAGLVGEGGAVAPLSGGWPPSGGALSHGPQG